VEIVVPAPLIAAGEQHVDSSVAAIIDGRRAVVETRAREDWEDDLITGRVNQTMVRPGRRTSGGHESSCRSAPRPATNSCARSWS
jgi:hypothetical protein